MSKQINITLGTFIPTITPDQIGNMIATRVNVAVRQALEEKRKRTGDTATKEDTMTAEEVRKVLSMSQPMFYSAVQAGKITMSKIGKKCYFSRNNIESFIRNGGRV